MIREFSETHRVRLRQSEDNFPVIPGKVGEIYEVGPARLAVMLLGLTIRKWNRRKAQMVMAGFRVEQDGDAEGACSFDPANREQGSLAIRLARVRYRRVLTPEQREIQTLRLKSFRAAQERTAGALRLARRVGERGEDAGTSETVL